MVTVLAALTVFSSVHAPVADQRFGRPITLPNELRTIKVGDKDVQVSTRRTVFITLEERIGKSFEHHRSVSTRPEEPAKHVLLQGRTDLVQDPGGGDTIVDRFFSKLMESGGSVEEGPDVFRAIESARRAIMEKGEKARELVDPNPGIKPDGWTERQWHLSAFDATLKFQITYEYEGYPDKTVTEEFSPAIAFGTIWRPNVKFARELFFPDDKPQKEKQISLGGVTFPEAEGRPAVQFDFPLFGEGERYEPSSWGALKSSITLGGYFQDILETNGSDKTQKFLTGIGLGTKSALSSIGSLAPRGNDMNALNFEIPEDPCDADFDAPPGLLWLPSEPGYQTMTTGVRYSFRHDFYTSLDLGTVVQQSARMRTMCMNMSLKEPAPNVMYFPYRASDPMLRELARKMDESSFRGPWDQARTWIYTDHATMDEINKRMSPPLSVGQYAMGLGDVGRLGGLAEADLKNPGMFRPDLIAGASAPPATLAWVVAVILDLHSDALVKYFDAGAPDLKALAADGAAKYQTDTLSASVRACTDSSKPPVRIAVLKWLAKNASGLTAVKGKVGDLRESLYSGDSEEVALAKSVIATGLAAMPKDAGLYLEQTSR